MPFMQQKNAYLLPVVDMSRLVVTFLDGLGFFSFALGLHGINAAFLWHFVLLNILEFGC